MTHFISHHMYKLIAGVLVVALVIGYWNGEEVEAASQWVDIEINSSYVDGNLTDFPVYVDLSDLPSDFWTTTNCTDIRVFKDGGSTEVPREIVSCTDNGSSGTGELHFLADGTLSSSATTTFEIHYDGSSSDYAASATYGSENVWSDYRFVSHDGGAHDSTANAHDPDTTTGATVSSGKIGDKTSFTESGYYKYNDDSEHDFDGDLEISLWALTETLTTGGREVVEKQKVGDDEFYQLRGAGANGGHTYYRGQFDGTGAQGSAQTTTGLDDGNWHYIVVQRDAGTASYAYSDGDLDDTGTAPPGSMANSGDLYIASYSANPSNGWEGDVDEIRLTDTIHSADWISTEYNNQNSPDTFYWISGEQTGGGGGGNDEEYFLIFSLVAPAKNTQRVS